MLHKPRGYVCTTSSKEGKSVYDLLKDVPHNVVCIGRLDKKSEGLLLFSNDGELVYRLTHPSFGHSKVYHVIVSGDLDETAMERLNEPMVIDGYRTRPARVRKLRPGEKPGRVCLEFTLQEGRNRQIRKMCESLKLTVHRLKRVQVCDVKLGGLRAGDFRDLNAKELRKLQA
jgi:23S rRNA pseudouridine2605 synthase